MLALSVSEPVGAALNVASGDPHTVLDLATAVASRSDLAPVVTGGFRLGDVRHVVGSPERAADLLGFRAETSFSDGMATFVGDRLR